MTPKDIPVPHDGQPRRSTEDGSTDDRAIQQIAFAIAIRRVETIAYLLKHRIPFLRCKEAADA